MRSLVFCVLLAGVLGALRLPQVDAVAADALRSMFGDRAVAWLEDTTYGALDSVQRLRHAGDRPAPRWTSEQSSNADAARSTPSASAPAARFAPVDVGPLYSDFAAAGDGRWRALSPQPSDGSEVSLYKTLIHPDRSRSFGELAVVAIDLSVTELYFVPGTAEPESVTEASNGYVRAGRIPPAHQAGLLAAFNGGFKTRHGRHGVQVDGVTLVPPRDNLCAIARTGGDVQVGTLSMAVVPPEAPSFFRQTAPCLVENGVLNPRLSAESTPNWGASVSGNTVIRRSAVGLSADRRTLFVGVGNGLTAAALARGMRHAGASVVAQLDVNEAFPRFLTYEREPDGNLRAQPIIEGLVYDKEQYIAAPSRRDFFYVMRRFKKPQ